MMKRLAYALAAVAATAGSILVVPAGSASASTSQCVTTAFTSKGMFVPVSAGGSRHCWLAQGSYSSAVFALQEALNYCHTYHNVTPDWDYGPITKAAVLDFQHSFNSAAGAGLAEDGVYGPATAHWMSFYVPGTGRCDYDGVS